MRTLGIWRTSFVQLKIRLPGFESTDEKFVSDFLAASVALGFHAACDSPRSRESQSAVEVSDFCFYRLCHLFQYLHGRDA